MVGVEAQREGNDCAFTGALQRQGFGGFNKYTVHVIPKPKGPPECR